MNASEPVLVPRYDPIVGLSPETVQGGGRVICTVSIVDQNGNPVTPPPGSTLIITHSPEPGCTDLVASIVPNTFSPVQQQQQSTINTLHNATGIDQRSSIMATLTWSGNQSQSAIKSLTITP